MRYGFVVTVTFYNHFVRTPSSIHSPPLEVCGYHQNIQNLGITRNIYHFTIILLRLISRSHYLHVAMVLIQLPSCYGIIKSPSVTN